MAAFEGTRRAYDAVAGRYRDAFASELDGKPFDRDVLARLAAAVPPGPVLDIGAGPGHVAAHLRALGCEAVALDLSPAMAGLAREAGVPAVAGDMARLPVADGTAAGAVAFYSLIHLPRSAVPAALAEIRRVLASRGRLAVAVHGGEGELRVEEFLGLPVPFTATLFDLGELAGMVEAAGFRVTAATERAPYPSEHPTPRLYVEAAAAG